MRETRKIATLITKQYKMGYTLTTSETRKLDKWKARSAENEDILSKLIEIFNDKEVPQFYSPPTEISVLILKHYNPKGFEPLSEDDLDKLNEWRRSSPENEEWFNRMKPNEALASISLSKRN